MLDPNQIKQDFPILSQKIHNKELVYLDNAATSQKPQQVIDAIVEYYSQHNANVHRGVHQLSDESTHLFENSRQIIAQFFGADPEELVLVRNTTEAINGVAYGWADGHVGPDDVILSTLMEHHSNLVVWQEVCRRTGARLELLDVDEYGQLDLTDVEEKLTLLPVSLVAFTHVSNTTGVINPIQEIISLVKKHRPTAKILVDGAQSAPHLQINFHQLDADFFAFSGHKMLAPMGSGGLLIKKQLLIEDEMKPWLFGGGMISEVYRDHALYQEDAAERFTAGTPDVASTVGLATACEYLSDLNMDQVAQHDRELVKYALEKLAAIPEIQLIGPTEEDRIGSVAFLYQGVHAHDVAQILDSEGVAVRSGHHCTMPLHMKFHWQATTRASFQVYNSAQDVDSLVAALQKVKKIFTNS